MTSNKGVNGLFFLVLLFHLGSCRQGTNLDMIVGVKIYETSRDYADLFDEWEDLGINSCFVSIDLARDKTFRATALEREAKLYIILPVFFNPAVLSENPGWYAITDKGMQAKEEWVEFVSPSQREYIRDRKDFIRGVVEEVNPDGISLDFIRYFAFWEKIYPDRTLETIPNSSFDSVSLSDFQDQTGVRIPSEIVKIPEIAGWIMDYHEPEFTRWKCRQIERVVDDIVREAKEVKSNLLINIHIVPWRSVDFDGAIRKITGQDVTLLAPLVDFLSPMCYSHMVRRDAQWVHDVISDINKATNYAPVLPSIQVKESYLSTPLTDSEFEENVRAALREPSKGVVLWSWDHLERDPGKKKVLKEVLVEIVR